MEILAKRPAEDGFIHNAEETINVAMFYLGVSINRFDVFKSKEIE